MPASLVPTSPIMKASKVKRRASASASASASSSSSTSTFNTIRRKLSSMLFLQTLLLLVVTISVIILGIQMHALDSHLSSSSSALLAVDSVVGQFSSSGKNVQESSRRQKQQQEENGGDGDGDGDGDGEGDGEDENGNGNGVLKLLNHKENKKLYEYDIDNDENVDDEIKPILKILRQGGYDISPTKESEKIIDRSLLPKWSDILKAYGPPKILGLETSCKAFQKSIPYNKRNIGPAGIFNTGTNLLFHLLRDNCIWENKLASLPKNLWQPPWGKHTPAIRRTNHTYSQKHKPPPYQTNLPVVAVRDPYTWMQSMCRQNYAAQFDHDKSMCPNIIPYPEDMISHRRYKKMKYMPVWVQYDPDYKMHYDSLAHLWNEWYLHYIEFENNNDNDNEDNIKMKRPSFPFLVVRMEDLVFHGQTVVPQLCECAGAKFLGGQIKHHASIANNNHGIEQTGGLNAGLLRSVIKYGNFTNRRNGYPKFQLEAAHDILDSRLMKLLSYSYEEP